MPLDDNFALKMPWVVTGLAVIHERAAADLRCRIFALRLSVRRVHRQATVTNRSFLVFSHEWCLAPPCKVVRIQMSDSEGLWVSLWIEKSECRYKSSRFQTHLNVLRHSDNVVQQGQNSESYRYTVPVYKDHGDNWRYRYIPFAWI
jgi:hypothetical protein